MISAVCQSLQSDSEALWADQCCINQNDPNEKAAAIDTMDVIYRHARCIFVLFEDIALSRCEWQAFVKIAQEWDSGFRYEHPEELDSLSRILLKLLSSRWFLRAWCSHELQLCQDCLFFVLVEDHVEFFDVSCFESLYGATIDYIGDHEDLDNLATGIIGGYDFLVRSLITKNHTLDHRNLMAEFDNTLELDCSVTSDKISICLNISGLQIAFNKEKKSEDECYWVASLIALAAGDVSTLCGTGKPLDLSESPYFSWLQRTGDLGPDRATTQRDISSVLCFDKQSIALDCYVIEAHLFRSPSQHALRASEQAFDTLLQGLIQKDVSWLQPWMTHDRSDEAFRVGRQRVTHLMGCALDCGIQWIIQQGGWYAEDSKYPDVAQHFEASLTLWLIESGLMTAEDVNSMHRIHYSKAQELLINFFLADDILRCGSFTSTQKHRLCQWANLGLDQKALCLADPTTFGVYELFVPKLMGDTTMQVIDRIWISLRIPSQTSTYFIVAKATLMTPYCLQTNSWVKERKVTFLGLPKLTF